MTSTLMPLAAVDKPLLARYLGEQAPQQIQAWGNVTFLQNRKVAFFCSQRCPGSVLVKMYDLAQLLSQRPITLIGGFQSPVEQEFLNRLLKSAMSAIVCPARSMASMRLRSEWQEPMQQGRLLLLSPFGEGVQRVNRQIAQTRNRFVAALADEVLIAFASPEGAILELCREVRKWKKKIYTVQDPANLPLTAFGAKALQPSDVLQVF
jgi:predicted Rossmann fold nucleotide-binding protein DprA/Smf involved in DNA uptake